MSTFLTAEWKDLVNITFAVDPALLAEHLPKGLGLDTIEGKAFVSLVAFRFHNIRLKGIKIPFHHSFPEINLRYYVYNKDGRRGVVFIKEFVPQYFVAAVARSVYNEPYETIPMSSETHWSEDTISTQHTFGPGYRLELKAENKPVTPSNNSAEHFFKEHQFGFGKDKNGNTLMYEVEHPVWEIFPVKKYDLKLDFGKAFGKKWELLNNTAPYNVLFAKGSEIIVRGKVLYRI
jgi:uncharacterized protein YqjF (DUF2071 family)